jgi:hypothetical protein
MYNLDLFRKKYSKDLNAKQVNNMGMGMTAFTNTN